MSTLGAYIIVKNEEDCIATCLNSITGICDEIVVVDTGCSDKTMEIVNQINANYGKIKTFTYEWCDDFSHARNFAMSKLNTEYSFTTDADEEFSDGLQKEIKRLTDNDFNGNTSIELYLLNYDKLRGDSYYLGGRTIVKKSDKVTWKYNIHEKLYYPEELTYTIPKEVGFIHHRKKDNVAVSNYNKYAELYFNEINEGMLYRLYNGAHFFFYMYFTLKDIDEIAAKQYLWHILEEDRIKATTEKNEAMGLCMDGHVSLGLYYVYSLLSSEKPNYHLIFNAIRLFPNDNLVWYVALNFLFENRKKISDYDLLNDVCENYGLLSYNNGEFREFVKSAQFHHDIRSWNNIAIINLDWANRCVVPFMQNYVPAVRCGDNVFTLPSKLYFLSKFWDEIIIISGKEEREIKKKINFGCFRKVTFTKNEEELIETKKILFFGDDYQFNREKFKADINNLMFKNAIPQGVTLRNEKKKDIKVATCVLTRLDNKYIREYVEYYKNLGTDKMVIFDNNLEGEGRVVDEVKDYVDSGFVDIIRWKYTTGNIQRPAYQYFYERYGNEYDWLACLDSDEYLIINNQSLKDFLQEERFNGYLGIVIPNVHYSDNDIIVNDKKERFNVYTTPSFNEWTFYKTFVRGHLENVDYMSPKIDGAHYPMIDNKPLEGFVDADGNSFPQLRPDRDNDPVFNKYPCKSAFIKHIPTGCIDDYINLKVKRGWPDKKDDGKSVRNFGLDFFSYYNTLTDEKIKYFDEHVKDFQ